MRISDWSSDVCSSDLNARNADVEPKSQNFIGEIPAGCEAMDDAFIRSLPHFLRQYLRRISLGVARMHNDRQPAFSRGSYVGAEAAFLLLAITVVIIIIKAGFRDADDLRMASAGLQLGGIHFRMRVSFMRMNANGRQYIGVALRSGQHRIPFIFARRNVEHDADRSEEHTSELQSLMRISYAVFCLKKKNTAPRTQHSTINSK